MFASIFSHRVMLADKVRMNSYQKAILEVVKEGDVVADIGTGSGILGFFALQAGARKVYAIEQNEIIEDAKKIAQENGWEKKIVFIKERSDKVKLPEKVDVITSELIGFFGLEENLNRFQIDARKRFLKPGGKLLPYWLKLYLSCVESKKIWNEFVSVWDKDFYGFDFSKVRDYAVSQRFVTDCSGRANLLSLPSLILDLDFYRSEEIPLAFSGELTINKKGTLHGLLGYFEVGLSPSVILSTSPQRPTTHWKQTFFPLQKAFHVKEQDTVNYKIKAIPWGNNIFWEWDTVVNRGDIEIVKFSQTNLNINKEELIVGRKDFKPVLKQEAEIYRSVLNLCDGNKTIGEIAEIIFAQYPGKYKTIKDVVQEVVGIVRGKARVT